MQYKKKKKAKKAKHEKEKIKCVLFPNSDNIRVCQSQSKGFFFAWPAMIAIIWTATFIILLAFEDL